jgi:hypothetical protein
LYGVFRSTVTTDVVITPLTRRARRPAGCCLPAGCARCAAAGALPVAGRRVVCSLGRSSTVSGTRVTSDRAARRSPTPYPGAVRVL